MSDVFKLLLAHCWPLAIIYPVAIHAAEEEMLDVVEVVAPDTDLFNQSLNHQSLNEADLQRSGQRELSQVLRATPGLTINQGMKGGSSDLNIRGASAGTGLLTIDGIPLQAQAPGRWSLDLFPAETFGGSDIVRGSAGLLQFGRGLGGAVNLRSRDHRQDHLGLHVEGGSFGSLRETLTADWANSQHNLNLTVGRDDIFDGTHWADSRAGHTERDTFHAQQWAAHLRDRFSEHLQLDSSLYYLRGRSGIDKVGLINPKPEFSIVDDPGQAVGDLWLAQTHLDMDLHRHWHSDVQFGHTRQTLDINAGGVLPNAPPSSISFDSELSLVRWKNRHRFWLDDAQKRGLSLNWGGEGIYERGESHLLNVDQRRTASGFAHLQINWDDWQSLLAVRSDDFDDVGRHTVYHASLNWLINTHWQWFISGGTGYRPPSLAEKGMWPFANPRLKPERSMGGETGLRWQVTSDHQLSVNYFHHRYDDLIKLERSDRPLLGVYVMNNIPRAEVLGLETQWHTQWHPRWHSGIDYTWTASENRDTGVPLPRQPAHIGRLWSEYVWEKLPLTLWTQAIYRSSSIDTGGQVSISDSLQWDLQLSYQVSKPLALYVRGENLTDNRESQVFGWGMSGAAVYGGFRWAL